MRTVGSYYADVSWCTVKIQ